MVRMAFTAFLYAGDMARADGLSVRGFLDFSYSFLSARFLIIKK